ncbi:FMN-binding negative transcriptional regulator [Marivivens sp. JLT3646]|uniref:FMN-binding negative transcriptional regulator n=1 Tax=Marivivens sp. JLT3646 TaxID=1920883 RepID=UPI0007FB9DB9|nr:FMN-binding negative transcriptional regulator [Marivivens sp. JLT3646]APO87953.1 negative transcriptional regulator [Marivivens sp. JLT3646]OBR35124.1 negative transcriptional regulator [Donghicola sp. JL3646]
MHPNPIYRQMPPDQAIEFARDRAFGTLTVNGDEGPLASHVPFLLSEDGKIADIHLVRSNPIVRAISEPQKCLLAVNGADSYISPDWYGLDDQVPTWNYVAAHLRGTLEKLPDGAMRDMLDRQSAFFESRLLPKTPWKTDKMPDDVIERMMRQIVPVRLTITSVDSTWKLAQNKTTEARLAASNEVDKHGFGLEPPTIGALMRATLAD